MRNIAMDFEARIRALSAEILALGMLTSHVLGRIRRLDPVLASAIEQGIADSAQQLDRLATKSRKAAPRDSGAKALATIRALRARIVDQPSRPRKNGGRGRRA